MGILSKINNNKAKVFNPFNENTFYGDAFIGELFPVWKNTPFAGLSPTNGEINNMAYHRALSYMLRDNDRGEFNRRLILYYYLAPYWDLTNGDNDLQRLFKTLSTDNTYFLRAMKNLCVLYDQPPNRTIKGSNEELAKEVLEKSNFTSFMQTLYLLLKVHNRLAYRPVINLVNGEKKIKHKIYTPDKYRITYDSYGNPTTFWLHKKLVIKNNLVDTFQVWDKKEVKKIDTNLKPIVTTYEENGKEYLTSIDPNRMGTIPYIELSIDDIQDDFAEVIGGAKFELFRGQLDCNAIDITINNDLIYNSFPIRTFVNYGYENNVQDIVISPSKIFAKDIDSSMETPIMPQILENGGSTSYLSLNEFKLSRMKQVLKNHGLPASIIDDNPGIPESGVAIKEMSKELLQLRSEDIPTMKGIEESMIQHLLLLLNTDPASPYVGKFNGKYAIDINYAEVDISKPFTEIVADNDVLKNNRFIDPLQYYINLTQDENITQHEDLLKQIIKNNDLWNEIEGATNEQPATEPSTGGTGNADESNNGDQEQINGVGDQTTGDGSNDNIVNVSNGTTKEGV